MTKPLYIEAIRRIERLHRHLLDLVGAEFTRIGWDDINPAQALILFHMRGQELTSGEIKSRGYYYGTNQSYQLKRLVEGKYIHSARAEGDARVVRLRLTPKGEEVAEVVDEMLDRHVGLPSWDAMTLGQIADAMQRFDSFLVEAGGYIGERV